MVLRVLAAGMIAGILFAVAWYVWFLHCNRRKAGDVLRWVADAFHGHGRVGGVRWLTNSSFQARLWLTPAVFRRASLVIRLQPREMPLLWLLGRVRQQPETLTFQADLDGPPSFDLEVRNHRWESHARGQAPLTARKWSVGQVGPFVATTRNDWQREITAMMGALAAARECHCSMVCFRRSSPHFSVTVPLEAIAPESHTQTEIFDVLREIAMGASAARF
jgi:hypothetical protein